MNWDGFKDYESKNIFLQGKYEIDKCVHKTSSKKMQRVKPKTNDFKTSLCITKHAHTHNLLQKCISIINFTTTILL